MDIKVVKENQRQSFNESVDHILQSWEWGEFRLKEGKIVTRLSLKPKTGPAKGYQLTFHHIPALNVTIGYMPRCHLPTKEVLDYLVTIGRDVKATFIKIEPAWPIEERRHAEFFEFENHQNIVPSKKPIFAKHTFVIDLTKSDHQLLAQMKPKTRYNLRLAQKRGVEVKEREDQQAFEEFLRLQRETAQRQGFYIHPDHYYRLMWQVLKPAKMAHLLVASYQKETLAAWLIFRFKKTIYYPYGSSSTQYKHLMASNLLAWEVIQLGKRLGCELFDFWGALGNNPQPTDPWYGFHRFKAGFGGQLVEFVGAYDLIINHSLYRLLTEMDKLRWTGLRWWARAKKLFLKS